MYKTDVKNLTTNTKQTNQFWGSRLHLGKECKIKILPGKADSGIVFKRVDLKENNLVHANYKNVSSARLCTTLKNKNGVKVSTVEHLLAALYISEIDNAIIEINSEEIPIMDGSAKEFLSKLNKVEIKELTKKRKYLKIVDSFEFVDGSKKISIEPNDLTFEIGFQLNYNNKIIGNQKNKINFQKDDLEEIIGQEHFVYMKMLKKLNRMDL